jgi:hypothetical protein
MGPGTPWQPLATDLAAALRMMPCTCVAVKELWPFKPKAHNCTRCKALAKYDAAINLATLAALAGDA